MRHLLQPRVLSTATGAAAVSTLACYPRLTLWLHRPDALWFLLANIFICAIILWGFVFAWHTPYTGRPVFVFKLEWKPFVVATLVALCAAAIFHQLLDPSLRAKFPEEYSSDLQHWLAAVLFSLALTQLLMVFAPCDWLMRLMKNRLLAMSLTGIFVAVVQAIKIHSLATPVSPLLIATLILMRFLGGFLTVAFYLRGGVFLVWWCTLILESRLLLDLHPTIEPTQ